MKRKKLLIKLVWCLSFFIIIGLQGSDVFGQTKPIRIGFLYAMTGDWTTTSLYIKNGIYMARDEWNAKGGINGRPIELVEADDGSKTAGAVTAFNKVINNDICAIFGETYSTQVLAQLPFIMKGGVPYICSAKHPKLTDMDNKWIFRVRANDNTDLPLMPHYIVEKMGIKKIAITYGNEEFARTASKIVEKILAEKGITPVAITTHTPGDKDFTAQLLKMKNAGAQCIITLSFLNENGLMIKQKHELGMDDIVFFGHSTLTTPVVLKLAGDAANYNVFAVGDFVRTDPRPEAQAWVRKYEDKYKVEANNATAYYYDGANILFNTIKRVGDNPEAIRKGLHEVQGFKGLAYTYFFDKNGDGAHAGSIVKIENGQFKVVETAYVKGYGPKGPTK